VQHPNEAKLIEMWREAIGPAPHMLAGLLEKLARAKCIADAMNEVVQAALRADVPPETGQF
jgi:hypothetical protein